MVTFAMDIKHAGYALRAPRTEVLGGVKNCKDGMEPRSVSFENGDILGRMNCLIEVVEPS